MAVTTADGQEYNLAGHVWFLPEGADVSASVKIDWTRLINVVIVGTTIPVMSARAVEFVKLYTTVRLGAVRDSIKPLSAKDYLHSMLYFAHGLAKHPEWLPVGRSFDWGDLTAEMFTAWLTTEYRTKRKGDAACLVRRFYLWAADTYARHPDFSHSLASVLNALTIKTHAEGELVESRDKRRGPFSREELELIFNACRVGAGTDQDRAMAWTLLETAIRPKQMYLLTKQDLELVENTIEESSINSISTRPAYRLRVRKIKQRGGTIKYHYLPLSTDCAELLLNLRRVDNSQSNRLFWWISPRYKCCIRRRLRAFSRDADLHSPRLPIENPKPGGPYFELLPITAYRFRYGVATDRIWRGETPEKVAGMLGHKDVQTTYSYIETSPVIAVDFQRATDWVIMPLVSLLEGRSSPSEVNLLKDHHPPTSQQSKEYTDVTTYGQGSAPRSYGKDVQHEQFKYVSNQQTSQSLRSEARINDLVEYARRRFPIIYPDQDFDAQIWNVTHLKERPNTIGLTNIGFTTHASTVGKELSRCPEDAFPAYFADVIKSWLIIPNNVSLHTNIIRLNSAKHFWNFLSARDGASAPSFTWGEISEDDFLAFEQFLINYRNKRGKSLSRGSIFIIINQIQRLITFLASWGICRYVEYFPQGPPASQETVGLVDENELITERKLPALGVVESLASIYYRLTTAPEGKVADWMLIIISAIAVLMLTGLRVGELVTLPFDCEVEDKIPDKQAGESYSYRYGIKYWVEKTQKKTMRIKWISPTAEHIVRACIARIKRLTAAARARAKVLEDDPTRVTLPPGVASRTVLSGLEVLALLGLRSDVPIRTNPHGLLPQHGRGRKSYFYVADLEAYLLSMRVPHLYTVRHDDGTFQMLSESLFVVFNKQSRCGKTNPCYLLAEPISIGSISLRLASPTNLFRTYGEADWQRELSANPHCLRHWLIHVAYKGGMRIDLLLRYFAKRYASSITDYLHFTTNETDAYAPEELRVDTFYVPV